MTKEQVQLIADALCGPGNVTVKLEGVVFEFTFTNGRLGEIVDANMDRTKIEADVIDRLEKGFRGDTSHVYPDWIYEARRAVVERDAIAQSQLRSPGIIDPTMQAVRHIHVNDQSGIDRCAACGLDLRDEIHLRVGEVLPSPDSPEAKEAMRKFNEEKRLEYNAKRNPSLQPYMPGPDDSEGGSHD